MTKPKILLWDIETSPIISYTWGLFDQNIGLNQIKDDWSILSFAAKWLDKTKVMYADVSKQKNKRDDKTVVKKIWKLLDEADIVVTQNGRKFDSKKANARFIKHRLPPPSPYRHIDTLVLAKKSFAFTSNKLEFMTGFLVPTAKKDSHKEFPGFELWKECLAGNPKAWKAMKEYNIRDVIALESLYKILAPWGTGVDFSVHSNEDHPICNCGSDNLQCRGYNHTNSGRFQRFQCQDCGAWSSSKKNLLSKAKRGSLVKK